MATKKPRITISLSPHLYETIKRMSELGGQPMASIVSEMLESVHDPLMRTVAFMEAAADAPVKVRAGLLKSFEAVERDLYEVAGHTVAQMDFLMGEMRGMDAATGGEGDASASTRTRGAVPLDSDIPAKANPHNVIRGSGLSQVNNIKHLGKRSGGSKNG